MNPSNIGWPQRRPGVAAVLALMMVAMFVFLLARGTGIYPVVFADEWSYSSYSRLLPLSQAGVPSYLYLLLFRTTSVCGDGFLDCARMLNCLFVVLAMPFIYKVARLVSSPWLACVVALLAVIGPINTYAIYFMPESMYFMGFWVLTWLALRRSNSSSLGFGVGIGVAVGLLSLIKVHALFIAPALAVYAAALPLLRREQDALRRSAEAGVGVAAAFGATKFIVGYVLAGSSALSIFGSLYSAQASGSGAGAGAAQLAPKALDSLAGHLMALAVLFTVPLARLAAGLSLKPAEDARQEAGARIRLYAVLVFATLLAVVAAFTATSEGSGPFETAGRLHMRYYNFAFPLLLIVAAGEFAGGAPSRPLRAIGAAILAVVAAYSSLQLLPRCTPSMVDSPELRGISSGIGIGIGSAMFTAVAGLGILAAIAWALRARWGAGLFLFVVVPLVALLGTWQVGEEVRGRQTADVYDEAGIFVKRYLGEQVSHLEVIAPHPAPLLRTLFHIDSMHVMSRQVPEGAKLDIERLPARIEWLLLIGNYELGGLRSALNFGKFSVIQVARERHIDFRRDQWAGIIGTSGLSSPEPWGTWSDGREVTIEFATTLPRDFELTLTGHAFNGSGVFHVQVGTESREFQLPELDGSSSAHFRTDGSERMVRISIARPMSPKQMGLSDDPRELGLGLRELTIKAAR